MFKTAKEGLKLHNDFFGPLGFLKSAAALNPLGIAGRLCLTQLSLSVLVYLAVNHGKEVSNP